MATYTYLQHNDPITREYLQGFLERTKAAIAESGQWMSGEGGYLSPEGLQSAQTSIKYVEDMLRLLNQYGVNSLTDLPPEIRTQLPNQGRYVDRGGGSLFQQALPVAALAAGVWGGFGLGGVGAGAGAAGATAAEEAAMLGAADVGAGTSAATAGGGATLTDMSWGVNPQTTSTLPPLAQTTGSNVTVGTAAGGNAAGPTVAGSTSGLSPFVNSGGVALPAMGAPLTGGTTAGVATPAAQTGQGAYQFPWQNVAGAVLGYMGQKKAGDTAEDLMRQQIESDQWRTQQPRYFEPIYEAATKGIGETAYGRSISDATARKMSSMGYNMSGNQMAEIAKSLDIGSQDYVRSLTPLATGRGESGAPAAFAPQITKAAEAPYGMMSYGLGEIFKGQQPQTGQGSNQNLWQWMGSLA